MTLNKDNHILLIATYDKMLENANIIVKNNKYPITVIRSSAVYLDSIINKWIDNGIEFVITRGGTFKYLKKKDIVTTVEIKVSALDILRAYNKINNKEDRICFIGWDNVVFGLDVFKEIFGKEIYIIDLNEHKDEKEVRKKVLEMAQDGVREFIGDSAGINIVKDMGFSGYMIESSDESISLAIQEALQMLDIKRQEQARLERLKIIMDFIHEGLVAIDEFDNIIIFNKEAEKLSKGVSVSRDELIKIIKFTETEKYDDQHSVEIKELKDNNIIAINRSPVVIDKKSYGMVATFQNINRIQNQEREIRTKLASKGLIAKYKFEDILYESEAMDDVIKIAKKYALSEATVLIQGKTGSGKELFAHSIHNYSYRARGPFVAVNCAAFQESLLESELFGYSDGAFTGAKKGGRIGLFELAHKGTIFLDEIGDMPLNLQSRLLRVIQEKEVMRLGDEKIIPVDIRIIASTNIPLEEYVGIGRFREDLFYRLNILTLRIPPLNERKEDIKVLADYIIQQQARLNYKDIKGLSDDALKELLKYNYRGNVRELRGIIERAVAIADGQYISDFDLRHNQSHIQINNTDSIKGAELKLIEKALYETNNNYTKAAKILGIDRSTLYRKVKALK